MSPREHRLVPALWAKKSNSCCLGQLDADVDMIPSHLMLPTASDDGVSSLDEEAAMLEQDAARDAMLFQQQHMLLSSLLNDPSFRIATLFLPPLPMSTTSPTRRPTCLRRKTVVSFTLLFRQCLANDGDAKSVSFCTQVNIATYTDGGWTTSCCMNISETTLLVDADQNDRLHCCKSSFNRSSVLRRHPIRDSSCTDPRTIRLAEVSYI